MLRRNEYPLGCVSTVARRQWSPTTSLFNAHVQCRTIRPPTATRHTATAGDIGIRITGMFRQTVAGTRQCFRSTDFTVTATCKTIVIGHTAKWTGRWWWWPITTTNHCPLTLFRGIISTTLKNRRTRATWRTVYAGLWTAFSRFTRRWTCDEGTCPLSI